MADQQGFSDEMQNRTKLAEQRQYTATQQQEFAIHRRAEQKRRTEQASWEKEKSMLAARGASSTELKRLEREQTAAYVASRQAEAEELTSELAAIYGRVDSLLAVTVQADNSVNLETFRRTVSHPPFGRPDLQKAIPAPQPIPDPAPPVLQSPTPAWSLFGRKQKMAEAQTQAQVNFVRAKAQWEEYMRLLPGKRQELVAQHASAEEARKQKMAKEMARYKLECVEREKEVAKYNADLDRFIANLGYGSVEAVQEYVSIVLANSACLEGFAARHKAQFDPESAELSLRVFIPRPDIIPTIKYYRYVRANDEITPVALSQKDVKERYLGIVQQVALGSLHTIFGADRRELMQSISLEIGTRANDPATGKVTYIPFLAVGASREVFSGIKLSGVVPAATLEYLGASVSKNPLGLVAANTEGVRRS